MLNPPATVPLERTDFTLHQLLVANSSKARDETSCPPPLVTPVFKLGVDSELALDKAGGEGRPRLGNSGMLEGA